MFKIYDLANLKIHNLNLDEVRANLDASFLQEQFEGKENVRGLFNGMNADEKTKLLELMDEVEKKPALKLKRWFSPEGLDVEAFLSVVHDEGSETFVDSTKMAIQDTLFYAKELFASSYGAEIGVGETLYRAVGNIHFSSDFITSEEIPLNGKIPLDRYCGPGADGNIKVMLNKMGETSPVFISKKVYTEKNWVYTLSFKIQASVDALPVVWSGIPFTNKLNAFFKGEGFSPETEGTKLTRWERSGDTVDFLNPPPSVYAPFILVRRGMGSSSFEDRTRLGRSLSDRLEKTGILESLIFYKANYMKARGMDKMETKDKSIAYDFLNEAGEYYAKCKGAHFAEARVGEMLCLWLKNRIAAHYGDLKQKEATYKRMVELLRENHLYDELLWFVEKTIKDKESSFDPIFNIFPLGKLEEDFFIHPQIKKGLAVNWFKAQYAQKWDEKEPVSTWHYKIAKKAGALGLGRVASERLQASFKTCLKDIQKEAFPIEEAEEAFNISLSLKILSPFSSLAKEHAKYFLAQMSKQGILDTSLTGRKAYRWESFKTALKASLWTSYASYSASSLGREKRDVSIRNLDLSRNLFSEGMRFFDPREVYSKEQIFEAADLLVAHFKTFFRSEDEPIRSGISVSLYSLWEQEKSLPLYFKIGGVLPVDKRSKMVKELELNLTPPFSRRKASLEFAKALLLADNFEAAAKEIEHFLSAGIPLFKDVEDAYSLLLAIEEYSPESASLCRESVFACIKKYQEETLEIKELFPDLASSIKNIRKV